MADLPTNLKDDILDSSVNTRRKYRMIENGDGTYSFEDATEYSQVGDEYGAGLINETNKQVNARVEKAVVVRDLDTIGAITQPGFVPDALALKDVSDSLGVDIKNKVNMNEFPINLKMTYGQLDVPFTANTEKTMWVEFYSTSGQPYVFPQGCFLVIPVLCVTASEKYEIGLGDFNSHGFTLIYNCQNVTTGKTLPVKFIAFGY